MPECERSSANRLETEQEKTNQEEPKGVSLLMVSSLLFAVSNLKELWKEKIECGLAKTIEI